MVSTLNRENGDLHRRYTAERLRLPCRGLCHDTLKELGRGPATSKSPHRSARRRFLIQAERFRSRHSRSIYHCGERTSLDAAAVAVTRTRKRLRDPRCRQARAGSGCTTVTDSVVDPRVWIRSTPTAVAFAVRR